MSDPAAGQDDAHPGLCLLQIGEQALPADHLGFGVFPHGTGVDDDELGVVDGDGAFAADGQKLAGHLLGVALIHLAAEGPDEEARQGWCLGAELGQARIQARLLSPEMRQRC